MHTTNTTASAAIGTNSPENVIIGAEGIEAEHGDRAAVGRADAGDLDDLSSHFMAIGTSSDRSLRLDGRRGLPYAASVEYRPQIAWRATYSDEMTNSLIWAQGGARALMVALTAIAITACTQAAKTETKLAAVDSSRQMPMSMPMNQSMPMGQMTGGCPLGLKTLSLTPSQKATFDSVRAENRAVMQRDMQAAFARARAVLTAAQRATFDTASATHLARMATMMSSGGCS